MTRKQSEHHARLREKGQVTLPKEIRAELDLLEGDDLVLKINENCQIVIERVLTIPQDQAWFWTERWQKMEREAQADIEAGRVSRFADVDEVVNALEEL